MKRLRLRYWLVPLGATALGISFIVAAILMAISLLMSIGGQSQASSNLPLVFAGVNIVLGALFMFGASSLQRVYPNIRAHRAAGLFYVVAAILTIAFYFMYPAYANLSTPYAAHSVPLWLLDVTLAGGVLSFSLASVLIIGSSLWYLNRPGTAPKVAEQMSDKKEITMTDLHAALKTEIIGTAGWDAGQVVMVRLQHGKDLFSYSLHVRPNSFSFSGIQITDMLGILGFQRSKCAFVNGGECYVKEVRQSFEVQSFAAEIKPMYDALCQAEGHFQTCGFSLDRPEGWGVFQGRSSQDRSSGNSTVGDGHTGHKVQRMKESRDVAFKFVFTWIESDRYRGWTTHYEPVHRPVSYEVGSVLNFLHLEQFASCPEFGFEPCYWHFVPFVERERDPRSANSAAYRAFDAHREHFSAGTERLLFANQHARTFGLRFLPESGPVASTSKILSAPAAYFGEIGRLFGMKTAGCSGESATLLVAPD